MLPIQHAELPNLLGAKCILKPLSPEHVSEDYVSWLNDEATNCYLESRFHTHTKCSVRQFVENQIASGYVLFYGIWSMEGRHIGNVKIGPIDCRHMTANIGFLIGNKCYWGMGIASEAIQLLVKFAFSLGISKITAGAYENNIGSIKALEKSGFRKEGYRAGQVLFQSKRIGTFIYGLRCS